MQSSVGQADSSHSGTHGQSMTLVLTEVSYRGIVMAADTALYLKSQRKIEFGPKVFSMPFLHAGLSIWGGPFPSPSADWISAFITNQVASGCPDIPTFATRLAELANRDVSGGVSTPPFLGTAGFHVAGYSPRGVPMMYHVHNGFPSGVIPGDNPHPFVAHDDISESRGQTLLGWGEVQLRRSGDYQFQGMLWDRFESMTGELNPLIHSELLEAVPTPFMMPGGIELLNRSIYRATQVHVASLLYRTSNIAQILGTADPHVAGDVHVLAFGATTPPTAPRVTKLSEHGVIIL